MAKPKKILIADDEEDISWAISRILMKSKLNVDVVCVSRGDLALDLIRQEPFDLVVSDVRMPGCSGVELIPEIRRLHPLAKIIIMTAYGSQDIMERADLLGSLFYLEKPFEIGYLKQLVLDALDLEPDDFRGSIDHIGLRELVEMHCLNKRSFSLLISRQEESGAIYFRNGDIVHAECGKLIGERAFFNILNWTKGTFKVDRTLSSNRRTISRDWKVLLHQCV